MRSQPNKILKGEGFYKALQQLLPEMLNGEKGMSIEVVPDEGGAYFTTGP